MKKTPIQFATQSDNPDMLGVFDIDASELAKRTGEVHLIDVRRPDEFVGELGHIAGARLLVLDVLPDQLDTLPKDEPIVFLCRSGARSTRAAAFAANHGFQHVFNMKGGMLQWNELGLPTENTPPK